MVVPWCGETVPARSITCPRPMQGPNPAKLGGADDPKIQRRTPEGLAAPPGFGVRCFGNCRAFGREGACAESCGSG